MNNSDVQDLNVEFLGKPINIIREKLFSLISESCCELTYELRSWTNKSQINIQINSVTLHNFSNDTLDVTKISILQHQMGGLAYVDIETPILIKLSDLFYDATVERASKNLTNSDLRIQEKICKLMARWLAPESMWEKGDIEFENDVGLLIELMITINDHAGFIKMKLNGQFTQTLIEEFKMTPKEDLNPKFTQALQSTPVRLNTTLVKKKMFLIDVLQLQSDDILPIELLTNAPVSIGNKTLFSGHIADNNGQLVLIIN